ncbi:uncharacterized protein BO80DRAFT_416126 [Aspergillus ibericus CBS 121593]|uniref:Uncharacterized protein n=1 Tax=Aspergillus ibericus CBS 121593 TaxID=1448316 RepID=A0A395GRW6_9EURO|nr:hypothetical protein BO80DRAFT_416126 [Aspergillus ibericus CBS 121593]RAK96823.1 hypothetical protein BO80DRAFT_416126 [Aspergillus ibericus CBS 121593]
MTTSLPIILALLLLNHPVPAQTVNITTAAQTGERVGWVSSPNTRSTSDILFSCLSVFLLCSWKCVHMNVPTIEESDAGWLHLWGCLPYWPTAPLRQLWARRVRWMVVIAIAPEIGVTMAYVEYASARDLFKKCRHLGFTMSHAFYACMGGFRFAIPREPNRDGTGDDGGNGGDGGDGGDSANDKPVKQGAAPAEDIEGNAVSGDGVATGLDYYYPWGVGFEELEELGLFPATSDHDLQNRSLPVVKEQDIHNASTSDALTKGLACLQCGWLVIQSIARAATGLPLTELELMTLAFIFCALIMYGLWWNKPFGVQRATVLLPSNPEKARAVLPDKTASKRRYELPLSTWLRAFPFVVVIFFELDRNSAQSVVCNLASIVFSGFHLIAWNWKFPSDRAQMLWRIFSVAGTGAPMILTTLITIRPPSRDTVFLRKSPYLVVLALTVVYTISRVGLFVLVFYCFSSMPAAVYETVQWSAIFPHFS